MPIDRNDLPKHLFGIPDLDLSEDLCAEPLAGPWLRLGEGEISEHALAKSFRMALGVDINTDFKEQDYASLADELRSGP